MHFSNEAVMDKWTELRTAYRLAKLGTLSATAKDIGVHRSTVMRHIDVLEASLKIKLFQRNDKGYIATQAGLDIMRLGEITDVQFSQFVNRAKSQEEFLSGTLTITCVSELSQLLFPTIMEYQARYPQMKVEIDADTRKYDLEYGEADLAIRTGNKPETLDNIVMPFTDVAISFCVHQNYIKQHGLPKLENITQHKFFALKERLEHLPWNEWVYQNIPIENINIVASNQQVLNYALQQGCGIGLAAKESLNNHPFLVEVNVETDWLVNTWLLVHRDMINLPKIRKFIALLKDTELPALQL